MKDFSRQPTRAERGIAVVLNLVLAVIFGALAIYLMLRDMPTGAAICGVITGIWVVMLYRAAFGASRALRRGESRALAWVLLFAGIAGFVILLLLDGSASHRLMLLGGAITFFSAGLVGVRSRGQDA
jgi:hypothetical protein